MARPLLPPDERRDERLPAPRVTAAEFSQVEANAATAGLTLPEYVRSCVLGQQITAARTVTDDRLLIELNRVGVNLNQIARAVNSDRPELIDLAAVLAELRGVLARIAGE